MEHCEEPGSVVLMASLWALEGMGWLILGFCKHKMLVTRTEITAHSGSSKQ